MSKDTLSSKLNNLSLSGAAAAAASSSALDPSARVSTRSGLDGDKDGNSSIGGISSGTLSDRKKIRAAFSLFDRDGKFCVPKEEVGTIMRYLGAYPSEEELVTDILPSLADDEESSLIRLERFEPFMLRVLSERLYEPDSEEMILQAFRVLDPENRGYIDEHTMHELLTENEWAFRDKEWEDFMRVAKDPETNYIHYEDFVSMLSN